MCSRIDQRIRAKLGEEVKQRADRFCETKGNVFVP